MNFIENALAKQVNLNNDDFLQAMSKIYDEPEVRKLLDKYPQYIQDVINIIDYDTELQMEGLESMLEGSMSERYSEIYAALLNCGAIKEANILEQARRLDIDSDDYDRQIEALKSQTALYNDYEHFWDLVRAYIGNNKNTGHISHSYLSD